MISEKAFAVKEKNDCLRHESRAHRSAFFFTWTQSFCSAAVPDLSNTAHCLFLDGLAFSDVCLVCLVGMNPAQGEWNGVHQVVRGENLVVRRYETGGGKVVPFHFRLCYADSTHHIGGISMKQAIIYARGRKRGKLLEQITVCKLFARRNGYRAVRVVCQTGSFPTIQKLARDPVEDIIIAFPSVLGSPAYFLSRRTRLNLAGKRVLIATKEVSA